MVYKIGITGGMASGKSWCLGYLQTKPSIYTINLDGFAFEVYKRNPVVLKNIGEIFGKECLTYRDGLVTGVNRARLGEVVF